MYIFNLKEIETYENLKIKAYGKAMSLWLFQRQSL